MDNSNVADKLKNVGILAVKWLFSVTFLIVGGASLASIDKNKVSGIVIGVVFLLLGLLLLPPLERIIAKLVPPLANTYVKIGVAFGLFVIGGFFMDLERSKKQEELNKFRKSVQAYVNANSNKPIIKNMLILNENYNLFTGNEHHIWEFGDTTILLIDPENLGALYSPLRKLELDSKGFLKADPDKGSVTNYELLFGFDKNKKIKAVNSYVKYSNGEEIQWAEADVIDFSSLLIPENIALAKEEAKKREFQEQQAEQARKARYNDEKFKEKCLLKWDGSCPAVEDYLKKNLKDPKSYEHIETQSANNGDYEVVVTKYRARNGFGGYTIGYIQAKVSMNCELISVDSFE